MEAGSEIVAIPLYSGDLATGPPRQRKVPDVLLSTPAMRRPHKLPSKPKLHGVTMTAKSETVGVVEWSCALSLRVAVVDDSGVPQLTLNGMGIPAGASLFHGDYVDRLNAYIKKMDGIIEEVGGVTASCINPYEDLKRALIGQKERVTRAEAKLTDYERLISGLEALAGELESIGVQGGTSWSAAQRIRTLMGTEA